MEVADVLAEGDVAGGRLGASLAVSNDGTRAAAGRPGDGSSPIVGAVLTYTYDDVSEEWQLDPGAAVEDEDAQLQDFFGSSVAIASGIMAVGAPGRDNGPLAAAGSVSIFEWNAGTSTWDWVSRITQLSGAQADARFGASLDLQYEPGIGWTLIVGAPGTLLFPTEPDIGGRAFVFSNQDAGNMASPWALEADLGILSVGSLGASVAISGPYAIVGDPARNAGRGRAYFFERTGSTWDDESVEEIAGVSPGEELGTAVAVDGPTAAIGSPFAEATCPPGQAGTPVAQGAVQVVQRIDGSWRPDLVQTLYADACVAGGTFGASVSISGDRIAVGTPATASPTSGDAHLATFQRTPNGIWFQASRTSAGGIGSDPDGFGSAVAVVPQPDAERAAMLAGWPLADASAPAQGAVLSRVAPLLDPGVDCNGNGIDDACEIAADGAAYDCNGNGIHDACDIRDLTSTDCNGNGVPDECETGDPAFFDCNLNGIFDACEILAGTLEDCNGNFIPDDCELDTVEIVFIVDASGSQAGKGSLVCQTIGDILLELEARGVKARPLTLAIDVCNVNLDAYPCIDDDDTVYEQYGRLLPGPADGLWPESLATGCETWSGASAIVAARHPWRTKFRVVVPISDECAWAGGLDPCDATDETSVEAALAALSCRDVMAMPIQFADTDGEYPASIADQMARLALGGPSDTPPVAGTGGQPFSFESSSLVTDFADAIVDRLPIHDDNIESATFNGPELDACAFLIDVSGGGGIADRNRNGISDSFEIAFGMSLEAPGLPGVPAEVIPSQCGPADADGDALVGIDDLLIVLADFNCNAGPCPGDLNADGVTDFDDLLVVFSQWGYCHIPESCDGGPAPDLAPSPGPPASIVDCLQRYGSDPLRLQRCIEAMILSNTP